AAPQFIGLNLTQLKVPLADQVFLNTLGVFTCFVDSFGQCPLIHLESGHHGRNQTTEDQQGQDDEHHIEIGFEAIEWRSICLGECSLALVTAVALICPGVNANFGWHRAEWAGRHTLSGPGGFGCFHTLQIPAWPSFWLLHAVLWSFRLVEVCHNFTLSETRFDQPTRPRNCTNHRSKGVSRGGVAEEMWGVRGFTSLVRPRPDPPSDFPANV
ncbi:hypothetical protein, partial [Deinococcus saxicola]|uniref:hypothetical protein n=1 Tax=Deinococcus saxicola TaxID=249406 RepID=UPI003D0B233D